MIKFNLIISISILFIIIGVTGLCIYKLVNNNPVKLVVININAEDPDYIHKIKNIAKEYNLLK